MKVAPPLATVLIVSILSAVVGIQEPKHEQKFLPSSHWNQRALHLDVSPPTYETKAPMPARRQELNFSRDSVTYFCVMVLTMQCMFIHTALSMARNTDELSGGTEPSLLTQTLTVAARSSAYPPIMCMLFVACRMYVLQTTNGLGEPQLWVKVCMLAATFGTTLQYLLVLVLPSFTAHWSVGEGKRDRMRFDELAGEPTDVHVKMESQRFRDEDDRATFQTFQALAVAFIYSGVIGVIVGIFTLNGLATKVSMAILGTVFLTILYLGVYFLLWLGNLSPTAYTLRAAARQALLPIRKVPMLAVLFLASRMRELQLNPPHGFPSRIEQLSFLAICGAVFLETVAALVIGATGRERTEHYGMPSYKSCGAIHACMHFSGFVVYCCLAPLVYGMSLEISVDGTVGPPLSSTLSAVLQFALMYFIVHILQWGIFMLQDLLDTSYPDAEAIILAADVSVRLCPLISILFVACRLRALQITYHHGSPQIWAQQAMFMSLFAMLVQVVSCLVLPLAMGRAAPADGDGFPDWNFRPLVAAYCVTVMKYVALFCLHGGVIMICVAIFTMTPDSAHMRGESTAGLLERETLRYCLIATFISFGFALFFSFAKVLGIIFKIAVEDYDKEILGCEITVRMAAISLLRGWVNIADVVVQNPDFPVEGGSADWSATYLMKVKRVRADLDMVKLVTSGGKVFEFEEIILEDVDINYDKPWKLKDNVTCILDHMARRRLQDAASIRDHVQPRELKKASPPDTKQFVFHKIRIQGVTAEVFVSGPSGLGGQMNVALADLNYPDFAKQVNKEADVKQELLVFIVHSLMETVAANVGPGKQMRNATKGAADCAIQVTNCLQGVCAVFPKTAAKSSISSI